MTLALNSTEDVVALRPDDGVRLDVQRGPRGIERLVLDLSHRGDETHCLVALPSLPNDFRESAQGVVRLWMTAAYRDDAGARLPFVVYVAAYRDGRSLSQQPYRLFAGPEETPLIFEAAIPSDADRYQLVFYADRRYRGILELRDVRMTAGATQYGIGPGEHVVGEVSLERRWRQEGRRAICASVYGEHWAEMPSGWRLDEVHPAALAAADWILYAALDRLTFGVTSPAPDPDDAKRRYSGPNTLLSYSLGTGSTAAMTLLPDETIRYYCQRAFRQYFLGSGAHVDMPDPSPWDSRVEQLPNTMIIQNTFELARVAAGARLGFGHNFGYAAIGLLLADFTDVGVLAFGSVLEQVFMRSGHLFADVVALPSSSFNSLRRLLNAAGLFLALPTAGCSEVVTSRISDVGRFSGLAISCPHARPDGSACGTCFKCFRRLRFEGRTDAPPPDTSVLDVLETYPLKSATSAVYAAQRSGYRHRVLNDYGDVDLAFLDSYFDYAVEHMLPPDLAAHARGQLAAVGIEQMDEDAELRLRTIGQVFFPESFSWSRAGIRDAAAS